MKCSKIKYSENVLYKYTESLPKNRQRLLLVSVAALSTIPGAAVTGGIGSAVNVGWSVLTGADAKSTAISAVSGYVGGTLLSIPGGKILVGVMSGVGEEATDQFIQNVIGDKNGYDPNKMAVTGAISGVANQFGEKLAETILSKVSARIEKELVKLSSKTYKTEVKAGLKANGFNGGDRALNIAANRIINREMREFTKTSKAFKTALQKGLERGMDAIVNFSKDKAKEHTEGD